MLRTAEELAKRADNTAPKAKRPDRKVEASLEFHDAQKSEQPNAQLSSPGR